jgi:hypothetical protein
LISGNAGGIEVETCEASSTHLSPTGPCVTATSRLLTLDHMNTRVLIWLAIHAGSHTSFGRVLDMHAAVGRTCVGMTAELALATSRMRIVKVWRRTLNMGPDACPDPPPDGRWAKTTARPGRQNVRVWTGIQAPEGGNRPRSCGKASNVGIAGRYARRQPSSDVLLARSAPRIRLLRAADAVLAGLTSARPCR